MSEEPTDVQTILAAIGIPILTALVFPGKILPLEVYTPLLLLILAYWGIQSLLKLRILLRGPRASELFPGFITNKQIVGLDAIVCIAWLVIENVMPYEDAWTLILMILAAIGFMRLARTEQ
jgi:hypothetical protein